MGKRDKVDPIFCGLDEMVGRPDLLERNGMGAVEPRGRGANVNVGRPDLLPGVCDEVTVLRGAAVGEAVGRLLGIAGRVLVISSMSFA